MTNMGVRRAGDHFKESGISTRAAEIAMVVGSVAFGFCGSVGVIAATTSFSTTFGSLAKVQPTEATVKADGRADEPLGDSGDSEPGKGAGDEGVAPTPGEGDSDKASDDTSSQVDEGLTVDDGTESDGDAGVVDDGTSAETETEEAPAVTEPVVYIVQRGDTLCEISAAYGVSVDAIANENQIRDVNLIYTGSALVIPA